MSPEEIMDDLTKYTGNTTGPSMEGIIISYHTILDIGNMISGFFAFLVVIGMFIISALDLLYIANPTFRDKVIQKRWDSSRESQGRQFISSDARNAVLNSDFQGKNPYYLYLKYRLRSYIIAIVLVIILLTGTNTLTRAILGLVKGIFNIFGVVINVLP